MSPLNQEARDQRLEVGDPSPTAGCAVDSGELPGAVSALGKLSGRKYWRSLEEFADTPEFRQFMHREFPAGAADLIDSSERRNFLKVMGASLALAGLGMTGCRRWPEEKIAPYAHRPAGRTPGMPVQYATSMELGGVACGLLVTSYDGRPIKIEGNPLHPTNGNAAELPAGLSADERTRMLHGASDAIMQASVLDLYDPDRSQFPVRQGKPSDWASFTTWAKAHFAEAGKDRGSGLAILSEASNSPSVQAMKQRLMQAFPGAKWHEYEPLHNDNQIKGAVLAFGKPYRAHYAFDKAKTIVSLDCDFLHCDPGSIKWVRDFAKGRRAVDRRSMSRLYAFESTVSLTGANADQRIALRSADVAIIAARLAAQLVPSAAALLQTLASSTISSSVDAKLVDLMPHLIADLKKGDSIVIAGPRQPAEVHLLAHMINDALGNFGKTISFTAMPESAAQVESINALASEISAGKVQTLVIIGGNPVYNAPVDLKFAELLKSVANTVHLSDYVDETSQACTWHINRAHYLESWGDGRGYDGTISICQPLIEPLFTGKSAIELLAAITGDELTQGYDIVRRSIKQIGSGGNFEAFWRTSLHDGVLTKSAAPTELPPKIVGQKLDKPIETLQQRWAGPKAGEFEIVFTPDVALYDGRFANNGWLQELPDPIAKLTWDNAVLMSPADASALGLQTGNMVTVKSVGREVTAAVMILPGQASGSVTLPLGYGREFAGRICKGAGFNFYKLRASDSMGFAGGASLSKTSGSYVLACTQDHHPVDTIGGRGEQERLPTLFREASLDTYNKNPRFANDPEYTGAHVVHRLSLWEEYHPFQSENGRTNSQYAWAMSIDLNSCTGCNACVIACQAENNIPVVGKDQVNRGREMHWIRIDRYFQFKPTSFDEHGRAVAWDPNTVEGFVHSPVTCQHCENAPCEQVCPVAATTHDDQGLNVMVYNRCVGTRYCSNNCPYKVRKFNYFDYHVRGPLREQPHMLLQVEPDYYTKGQAQADPLKQMQFNPEVTVRMRGIMEKCTYCVQRISNARIQAKNDWVTQRNLHPDDPSVKDVRVPIKDGTITPACAQSCPAQAIVFGDLNDPTSRVSQLHKHERSYQMLEELNTKPRTRYLAKLRNPSLENSAPTKGEPAQPHTPPA